jgi:hypothetical protein
MSSSVVLAGSDRFLSRIPCTVHKNSYVAFTHKVIHCREVALQGTVVLLHGLPVDLNGRAFTLYTGRRKSRREVRTRETVWVN